MPTKAVTGTKQMKTTSTKKDDKAAKADEPDPQEGHYHRRNWTDEDGVRHTEELRPRSNQWVEVETD